MDKSCNVDIRYFINQNLYTKESILASSSFEVCLYEKLNSNAVYNSTSNTNTPIYLLFNINNKYYFADETYYNKSHTLIIILVITTLLQFIVMQLFK